MLSRDKSGLDSGSATARRWRLLRDAGAEISVCVAAQREARWEDRGLRVKSLGGGFFSKWSRLYRLAQSAVRSSKFDLITAQDPFELGWIAYRLGRKYNTKFEIQDHGGFFDGEPADEPLWFLRSRLAWFLARRAAAIRTVSPKSQDKLAAAGLKDKTYFLPIAAEEKFKYARRQPEAYSIVSVGRLATVKRFDVLIRSFAEFRKRHSAARLTIVGDGPQRAALERLILSLDIMHVVKLPGAADPLPYLERAALFVLLSKHEGWGVAAVEAQLAGVPVLMTDTGCARTIGAQIVPLGLEDPAKIAGEMEAACASPQPSGTYTSKTQTETALEQVAAWSRLA